jgi:hypothetical protein
MVLFVRKFFVGVATVGFGNLRSRGSIRMVDIGGRFFGWHTRDAIGEFEVLGFGNDEEDVAMVAIA